MLNIHCISLQSKREERFNKIQSKYKPNINLIEEEAFEGSNKKLINELEKEYAIKFDDKASYGNKALFLKAFCLWKDFYNYSDEQYLLIIEDDVIPNENMINRLEIIKSELPKDYDICILMGRNFGKVFEFSNNLNYGNPFSCIGAYMITKSGAKKLMNIASKETVTTHPSGGVMDYWVGLQINKMNFYKAKNDLFSVLNIPSTLSVSRNKLVELYFPKLNNFLVSNYLFTLPLEDIGLKINGKITITYYIFFNLLMKIMMYLIFKNLYLVFTILGVNLYYDIRTNVYLHEEISNKIIEFLLSLIIFLINYFLVSMVL